MRPFAVFAVTPAIALLWPFALRSQDAPAPHDGAQPAAASRQEAIAATLDAMCRPVLDAELAVGFVAGAIDGDVQVVRGYGRLTADGDAAPDATTVWEIGSISKVFTGLLLADAVQRGLVALDDPVQQHLPAGTTLRTFGDEPIRLWHLATHSSGLPRLAGMEAGDPQDPYAHIDEAALLAAVAAVRPRRGPGAGYEYSNFGAGLLGFVLMKANGCASYGELLQRRIAGPLGMRDTSVALDDAHRACLAPPHDGDLQPAHTWDLAMLAGAGGIRSTLADMLTFARAELAPADTPLADAIALSQQRRFEAPNGPALALGWHFGKDGATLWHNGQTGGYHGYLALQPAAHRAVCILANTSAGQLDQVGQRILQSLDGTTVEPPRFAAAVRLEAAQLDRLVGRYRMGPGAEFAITRRGDALYAQLTGQDAFRVHARSPTEFVYRVVDARLTFELDGDAVTALVLHQNGRDMRCVRVAEEAAK